MKISNIKYDLPIDENVIISKRNLVSGEQIIVLKPKMIRKTIENWVKNNFSFHISSLYVIDEIDRFELFYYVIHRKSNLSFILAEVLDYNNPTTQTISDLSGTIFYEGEATEMFGINFEGNKVTEVFLPENWNKGFPMRKGWEKSKKGDKIE